MVIAQEQIAETLTLLRQLHADGPRDRARMTVRERELCAGFPQILVENGAAIALRPGLEPLSERRIAPHLSGPGRLTVLDAVDSTQNVLLTARRNVATGDAVIAEFQYSGRGQRGNRWLSAPFSGLTVSVAWHFASLNSLRGLPVALGGALAGMIADLGFPAVSVKWPNDLYLSGQKCGGILVETEPVGREIMAVTGVGLNVLPDPEAVPPRAALTAGGQPLPRNNLAIALIRALRQALYAFSLQGVTAFADAVRRHDLLYGRQVEVATAEGTLAGIAHGIDREGSLLIAPAPDQLVPVHSGHVVSWSDAADRRPGA